MGKSRSTRPNPEYDDCLVAYELGFAGSFYVPMAASFWRTAAPEDPVPPYLDSLMVELKEVLHYTEQNGSGGILRLVRTVEAAADRFRDCFERAWGCGLHRRMIRQRDQTDPECFDPADMLVGSPFDGPEQSDLSSKILNLLRVLPEPTQKWGLLGSEVAEWMDPARSGETSSGAKSRIWSRIESLHPHPLLRGFPRSRKRFTKDAVIGLHDRLQTAAAARKDSIPNLTGIGFEYRAIALLLETPTLSMTELAKRVGVSRTSLYRYTLLNQARAALKAARADFPRGFRNKCDDGTTTLDAIDE